LKIRRPPPTLLAAWIALASLMMTGLIVGFAASKPVGIALFVLGCLGYLILGVYIYAVIPRRARWAAVMAVNKSGPAWRLLVAAALAVAFLIDIAVIAVPAVKGFTRYSAGGILGALGVTLSLLAILRITRSRK
jgi:hypothetical protein